MNGCNYAASITLDACSNPMQWIRKATRIQFVVTVILSGLGSVHVNDHSYYNFRQEVIIPLA